jgi:hypothetical protein
MKLKTGAGEIYFNPQTISRIHLSPEHELLTVHFINGTTFASPVETPAERACIADFLGHLTDDQSGFMAIGKELLNLKSALWISIPDHGPIQIRAGDNRNHVLTDEGPERIRRILGE